MTGFTTQLLPIAYDKDKAVEIWADLESYFKNDRSAPSARLLSDAIFGNSPYLAQSATRMPEFTARILRGNPSEHFNQIIDALSAPRPIGEKTEDLMHLLRIAKSEIALLTAVADIAGWWSLYDVTHALTKFADYAVTVALSHLMHEAMTKGDIPWPNGAPEPVTNALTQKSGYFVLGMGKHGAAELNYSSDIDLIIFFDPDRTEYLGRGSLSECYIKITQKLVQILDQRTMHGYVFRTDLRLRPDPGATPIAINVSAAENYYHAMAVNWERSAMIKARIIAGDFTAGDTFMKMINQWVWRRSMDYAALKDIAAIKNQINRHYGQNEITFEGFDVKLGQGGIREIEFFAQVNQLLFGGRHPSLQVKQTIQALENMVIEGLIDSKTLNDLDKAYEFWRTLEHRLQMINDEQTHTLPTDQIALHRIANFMGFERIEDLKSIISHHAQIVKIHYDSLLPDVESGLASGFQESELLTTLTSLGFQNAGSIRTLIEGWRRGRYRALRTKRAKGLLDSMLPTLLKAFADMDKPDEALMKFDSFLSKLPAGVQLFSMLQANPNLFKLLARIMGLAPALADTLSKSPDLWENVLEPGFYAPVEDLDTLATDLRNVFARAEDYQDVLASVRHFVSDYKFRIGVHLLESIASVSECGEAMTRLADVSIQCLVPETTKEFARRHGSFPDGGIAILAMGKYGGYELTHTSDLDIVFLYDCVDMHSHSNGKKPLPPSQYFSRLGQNIITAITALTPEGRLFEVDTRLRPSGNQGPLVVTLNTFQDYYKSSAWTWEHMALTRARPIVAADVLVGPINDAIRSVLTAERDPHALKTAVSEMRQKLYQQFGSENIWSIKHTRGGLVDMEFICQYLMLREGNQHPQIFNPSLSISIDNLCHVNALSPQQASTMHAAHHFQQKIQSLLRLSLGASPSNASGIPYGLRDILQEATDCADFETLLKTLTQHQTNIYSLFQTMLNP